MTKFFRRFFAAVLSLVVITLSVGMTASAENEEVETGITVESAVVDSEKSDYDLYRESFDFSLATEDVEIEIGKTLDTEDITFEVNVPADGLYKFGLSYKALGTQTSDLVFGLKIDGEYPFADAQKFNLFRIYTNQEGGNRVDGLGNEFAAKQIPYDGFYFDTLADITRWTDEEYLFGLTAGTHTVTLVCGDSDFEIESVKFLATVETEKYKVPSNTKAYYKGKDVIIEGETAVIKTGKALAGLADNSTLDVTPNDAYKILVNYIGGNNWKTSGQTLVWETPEMEAGYYKLGFSFRQSTLLGAKVYRSLKIDGVSPFEEAESIGFNYSYKWQQSFFEDEKGSPYLIYIPEGKHTVSLEVTTGDIAEVRNSLKEAVAQLSDLYVKITMITGETVDLHRDYDLFAQIPNMEQALKDISQKLSKASERLQVITGEKSGSYISIINNMKQITDLMLDNRYTAHQYKNEYYSKYTSLASVLYEMTDMPLDIDKISFISPETEEPFEKPNFFERLWFAIKKFFISFVQEYNNISGLEGEEDAITIWVNWGRDQAQVLNSLIKSEFTKEENIPVNLQIVNATVVQAVLSGKGPDCLLQHSRSEPVNLAMRGMLYDLKQFDDCDDVLKSFQEGAETPYYYKGGLYALPDTQSFYLMFYRTDIFEQMGLTVPETWDEFEETVKLLTRNNLTAWLPNNTATSTAQANIGIGSINLFPTLLMQQGLDVYEEDGRSTNLGDSKVIMAFREWTDFYTKLKLPRTMNF